MSKYILIPFLVITTAYTVYLLLRPKPIGEYSCPQREYIDCMPSVTKENDPYCYNEYQTWIESNCPDIQYVY